MNEREFENQLFFEEGLTWQEAEDVKERLESEHRSIRDLDEHDLRDYVQR